MVNENALTVVGKANFHGESRLFGMKLDDRRRHMHAMGKTGMGKTSFLLNMAVSDINNGHGFAFIDPHGDVTDDLLNYIPEHRIQDVIYFSPADMEYPLAFNVLGDVPKEQRHIVGDGLVGVFQKIWADSWGPRLEYILRNAINTLLQYPETTLLDIMKILVDKEYRKEVVDYIDDPVLKSFWINEFNKYNDKMVTEAISPIQNKVGQFTSSPLIRNIIGQKKSSFDIRKIMDERKILLMNLSKGATGEGGAQLLGAMMITKMQLAAMSRVDIPQEERKDFFAYVDEFQNFSTDSFAEILSEARKYRLGLILAHQYIEQLSDSVRAAVFGNVGTTALFRIGAGDAEHMEKEFGPDLTAEDLVNLPKYHIYVKLMIDGVTSKPFMSNTLPNPPYPPINYRDQIIENSRKTYGRHIDEVSQMINDSSAVPEITVPGGKKNKKPSKTVVWKNPALEGTDDSKQDKKEEKKPESKVAQPQHTQSQPTNNQSAQPAPPQPKAAPKPAPKAVAQQPKPELAQSQQPPVPEKPSVNNNQNQPQQEAQPQASPVQTEPTLPQTSTPNEEFRLDLSGAASTPSQTQSQSTPQEQQAPLTPNPAPTEPQEAPSPQEEKVSFMEEIAAALQEEIEQMPDWKPAPEGVTPNGAIMQPRKEEKKKWDKKKKKKKNFDKKPSQSNGQQLPPDLPPLGTAKEGESANLMAEKLKQMFAAKETDDGQKVYEVKDDFKRQQEEKERLKQEEREAKRKQRELERQQAEAKKSDKPKSPQSNTENSQMPTLKKPVDDRFDLSSFKKPSNSQPKSQAPEPAPEKAQQTQEAPKPQSQKETQSAEKKQEHTTTAKAEPKPDEHKHKVEPGQTVSLKSESAKNTNQQPETKKVEQPPTSSQETSDKVEPTESMSSLVGDLLTGIQDGHSGKSKQEILHQAFHDNRPTEKRVLKAGQVIQFKKK